MTAFDLHDTIAAVASPPGASACGILRLSGPAAIALAAELFTPREGDGLLSRPGWSVVNGEVALRLQPYTASDAAPSSYACPCLLYLMRAPKSYTAEDVIELHLPGAPVLLQAALRTVCAAGARVAAPGEFTLRAFVNGRLDLGQAESVGRVIAARNDAERRQALARLASDLSQDLASWREELLQCASQVEAALDFEEEELGEDAAAGLEATLQRLAEHCRALSMRAAAESPSPAGTRVRLVGQTNAGKSSIVNALLGQEAVCVSATRSTTRDRLLFPLAIEGLPFQLEDAAGQDATGCEVTRAAAARALERLGAAPRVCLVVDAARPEVETLGTWLGHVKGCQVLLVLNKIDLLPASDRPARLEALATEISAVLQRAAGCVPVQVVQTSALTCAGVEPLRSALRDAALGSMAPESDGDLGPREAAEIAAAAQACEDALQRWHEEAGLELVADEIRTAYESLHRAMGQGYGEAVLTSIFSRFCVGK